MRELSWEHADLVRISGQSSSVVSQWLGKGSKVIKTIGKHEAAQALAHASGYSALWIAKGIGPEKVDARAAAVGANHPTGGVAQAMSLKAETVEQICPLAWEAIVSMSERRELPPLFSVALPDDSMASRAKAGSVIVFDSREVARPGDGVLVRDREGNLYFRIFRQRRQGSWEAHALNEDYQPMESERDGLEVLAVLTAVQARWG